MSLKAHHWIKSFINQYKRDAPQQQMTRLDSIIKGLRADDHFNFHAKRIYDTENPFFVARRAFDWIHLKHESHNPRFFFSFKGRFCTVTHNLTLRNKMSCAKIQKGSVLPTFWLQSGHRNEEKSLCLDKASAQPSKKILEKNPIKTLIYRMDTFI